MYIGYIFLFKYVGFIGSDTKSIRRITTMTEKTNIWDSSQCDAILSDYIKNLANSLENVSDSKRSSFIREKLKDLFEEKVMLG